MTKKKATTKAKSKSTGRAPEYGEYGNVLVVKGAHKGKIGYYDNDEGKLCIVYFGVPFLEGYYELRRSSLVVTDQEHPGKETLKKIAPKMIEQLGVY